MTANEFFGDWYIIVKKELNSVVTRVSGLYKTTECTPFYKDIFKCFTLCTRRQCKVIILGQDPYPQRGIATGVAFANNGIATSPSLKVLMRAAGITDPTLESVAKQGVLFLNSALTCEIGKPASHSLIWKPFIRNFLKEMNELETGMIYILLGETAKTFKGYIGKYNYVLTASHPAYYAREGKEMPETVFSKTNQILKDIYGKEEQIQWDRRD